MIDANVHAAIKSTVTIKILIVFTGSKLVKSNDKTKPGQIPALA